MRTALTLAALVTAILSAGPAGADCACPPLTLDDRIAAATYIFRGRPVAMAQVPPGDSPFHTEQTLEAPRLLQNDLVTLFRIETQWKGAARKMIRVRSDQGVCGVRFPDDADSIVFAQIDAAGILWTRRCSGNLSATDGGFDLLADTLVKRLRFD